MELFGKYTQGEISQYTFTIHYKMTNEKVAEIMKKANLDKIVMIDEDDYGPQEEKDVTLDEIMSENFMSHDGFEFTFKGMSVFCYLHRHCVDVCSKTGTKETVKILNEIGIE